MIGNVLETGEGGTKTIRKYTEVTGKTEDWKKVIAKQKASKGFIKALNKYEDSRMIDSG